MNCTTHWTKKYTCIVSFLFLPLFTNGAWDNWRGPNYNGSSSTDSALPQNFDSSRGVKWKSKLPGASAATPIVTGDLIFIPSISISKSGAKGEGQLLRCAIVLQMGSLYGQGMQAVDTDLANQTVLIICFMIVPTMPVLPLRWEMTSSFSFLVTAI